jgi:hypothetical protein
MTLYSPNERLILSKVFFQSLVLSAFNGAAVGLFILIGSFASFTSEQAIAIDEFGGASMLLAFMNELYDNDEFYSLNGDDNKPSIVKWAFAAAGFVGGGVVSQGIASNLNFIPTKECFKEPSAQKDAILDTVSLISAGAAISVKLVTCSSRGAWYSFPAVRDILFTAILSVDGITDGLTSRNTLESLGVSAIGTFFFVATTVIVGALSSLTITTLLSIAQRSGMPFAEHLIILFKSFIVTSILDNALIDIHRGLSLPVIIGFTITWCISHINRMLHKTKYECMPCICISTKFKIPLYDECDDVHEERADEEQHTRYNGHVPLRSYSNINSS